MCSAVVFYAVLSLLANKDIHYSGDDCRTTRAGKTSEATECFDGSAYPLEQTRPCNGDCGEWTVQLIGHWSDCQLLSDTPASAAQLERVGTVRAGTAYCGIGRRYHAVVCTTKDGRHNVSATVCGATGRPTLIGGGSNPIPFLPIPTLPSLPSRLPL